MTTTYITKTSQLPTIVLGSSSPFRKAQLETLKLPFTQFSPDIDESPLENESVKAMVKRLSLEKAKAVRANFAESIVIASDQSAEFEQRAVGKPGSFENAVHQLSQFSGHTVTFHTGLCLYHPAHEQPFEYLETTEVSFRKLSTETIQRYLEIEQPLNCAGSFKSEGLGVTLFERISSRDANALIGLPLMGLTDLFLQMGIQLPLSTD